MMTPTRAIILYICCSTCSQAKEERTSKARAMAISLGPPRDQGPLHSSRLRDHVLQDDA